MNNWFEIDNAGWKRMNAGREPAELVKELIQNVLDEEFTTVNIDYSYDKNNNNFVLCIEDDIEYGIKDSSLITTVFMTGKEDSPLKRGRKGRGLKEFLSVCKYAIVETVGKTVEFRADGTRKDWVNIRTIGTKISCIIEEEKWNKSSIKDINTFLRKIIVYNNGKVFINGKELEKRNYTYRYKDAYLKTQIIENGKQIERRAYTDVLIYEKSSKEGWLYEMGIPVVKTDIPYDIDIQQRVVLNDNRNEVGFYYLQDVKKCVVKCLLDVLDKKDLLGWASEGLSSWDLTDKECEKISCKIAEVDSINNLLIKTKDKNVNDKAIQKGFDLFDFSSMDSNFKDIFSKVVKTSEDMIIEIEKNTVPIIVEPTEIELKFINEHKKLAKVAIGKDINIKIVEKPKDMVTNQYTLAYYQVGFPSELFYNRLAISNRIFENPYSASALDTLFHELGHEDSSEHDFCFIDAVTKYAGKITAYLMKSNLVKEKVEKKSSIKDDIKSVLSNTNGIEYMSLSEIYSKLNVSSTNEKAGIRSVLNKECANNGIFERSYEGGRYRLRFI